MSFFLKYLRPVKRDIASGLTVKFLASITELMLPMILTYILEVVILDGKVGRVVVFGVVMILCALLSCFGHIIANRRAAVVSREFAEAMRRDLFDKTLMLSACDADRFTIPSLESRITSDTYNVQNFIGMMLRMGVRAPIMLIGGLAISLVMDYRLALVMLATTPVIFVIILFVRYRGVPLYAKVQKSTDDMVRVVREDTQGIRVIKALSKNEYENRRFSEVNAALSREERRAGMVMGIVNPVMTLLMNLGIAAVVALSAYLVSSEKSSAATVIALMQYFTQISMAMMAISRMFVGYSKCSASAKRINEVLLTEERYTVDKSLSESNTDAYLEFKSVSFSYFGRQNNLEDISFSLGKGQRLGIIGATGSGKSTLIKLILRFYESDEGEIYIGGRNIKSYARDELSSLFGVAQQNDFLYADTIEENIKFGREIPTEQVRWAARVAQADGFISEGEGGYSRILAQKGTNISGGQKQRILIARAIAARPKILILDDSSSALDYKTDAELRAALARELSESTVITVAQRVSSVKSSDLILVLDEGRIIGKGTHEELLVSCPEYKEISDSQMGGAIID